MKRTAAICGPTPSFVRWAIRHDCPLRENDVRNLPDATFRQLRGLRELSLAIGQSRVVSGVCIHPGLNSDAETARGFFADEIAQIFDGTNNVQRNCVDCLANAVQNSTQTATNQSDEATWAGCYGRFPSVFASTNFVGLFGEASSCGDWYRFWAGQSSLMGAACEQLISILNEIRLKTDSSQLGSDFCELESAATLCLTNELSLEIELIPSGFSDGSTWTIEPHCSACKKEIEPNDTRCSNCGESGTTHPAIKRKVLGLRPYGLLKQLVGHEQTKVLIQQYHQSRL